MYINIAEQLYLYERYQQQPIFITQCFMDESLYGSTIQYLSDLKSVTVY